MTKNKAEKEFLNEYLSNNCESQDVEREKITEVYKFPEV